MPCLYTLHLLSVSWTKIFRLVNVIGMGFDGAATFSGKKIGVQARLKQHAPHALFVCCHCHMLQLACVQSANKTTGIKQLYVTITTIWKYLTSRTQSIKEIQQVLELPELKVIKPSDTRWLAHEHLLPCTC